MDLLRICGYCSVSVGREPMQRLLVGGAVGLLSLGNWLSSRTSSSTSVLGRVTASAAGESR